ATTAAAAARAFTWPLFEQGDRRRRAAFAFLGREAAPRPGVFPGAPGDHALVAAFDEARVAVEGTASEREDPFADEVSRREGFRTGRLGRRRRRAPGAELADRLAAFDQRVRDDDLVTGTDRGREPVLLRRHRRHVDKGEGRALFGFLEGQGRRGGRRRGETRAGEADGEQTARRCREPASGDGHRSFLRPTGAFVGSDGRATRTLSRRSRITRGLRRSGHIGEELAEGAHVAVDVGGLVG